MHSSLPMPSCTKYRKALWNHQHWDYLIPPLLPPLIIYPLQASPNLLLYLLLAGFFLNHTPTCPLYYLTPPKLLENTVWSTINHIPPHALQKIFITGQVVSGRHRLHWRLHLSLDPRTPSTFIPMAPVTKLKKGIIPQQIMHSLLSSTNNHSLVSFHIPPVIISSTQLTSEVLPSSLTCLQLF